jgi:hypothetical protein
MVNVFNAQFIVQIKRSNLKEKDEQGVVGSIE